MKQLEDLDGMPFGAHKGKKMQDVSVEYLHWFWHKGQLFNADAVAVKDYIQRNLLALKKENEDLIWS